MGIRHRIHEVIFEAETRAGRAFDVGLLWIICLSIVVVILDSVPFLHERYGSVFIGIEWVFTAIFALEYLLRISCIQRPWRYALSFYGIIDLLAIVPGILNLILGGSSSLLVVRAIRLLRVFRILKLGRHLRAAKTLQIALMSSRPKIVVFLGTVLVAVTLVGTLMYLIEGEEHGFTSIPVGIYWGIVTMTTVGYGDIVPHTILGKCLAGALMILGYGVLAVPTGIVSVELAQANQRNLNTISCPGCAKEGHDEEASFCDRCGHPLEEDDETT